jgi:hypothetical protein
MSNVSCLHTSKVLPKHARHGWRRWSGLFQQNSMMSLDPQAPFSDLIVGFHEAGRSMQAISRSNCRGLVVPSYKFYKYLAVTKKLVDSQQLMQIVDEEYEMYKVLFHRTDDFNKEFPYMTIADTFECMENSRTRWARRRRRAQPWRPRGEDDRRALECCTTSTSGATRDRN